jgi:outer membrane protein insertion porin family
MPTYLQRVREVAVNFLPTLPGGAILLPFLVLSLWLPLSVAHAGTEPTVMEVIVLGTTRVEPAAVLNVVTTKKGDPVDTARVDSDVRAIYHLGLFQDVNAAMESVTGGVKLLFNVQEKPFVREIEIKGNKELSADKIKEVLAVKSGTVYTPRDLGLSVKKIKKLYADDGYYLAEVVTATTLQSPADMKVTFTIKEGDKIYITDISFLGNKAYTAKQLKKVMETKEKWFLSWLTGAGTYKEESLKNDVNLVADYYMNNGYANVKVGEAKVRLLDDKSGLVVTIGVTEGDQFRTGSVNFKGDQPDDLAVIKGKLQTVSGEIFSRGKLRADVFTLTDSFGDKGYAFANISPMTKVNAVAKTIDLTFDMEKGEKIYIDRINISGNGKTRDKVIRREMRLYEGQLSSGTGLKRSKQNLMNLGFFEDANLSTTAGSDEKKMNVNVEVKEKPTGTFSFGAGYSSVDGIVGQGSVSQSNFLGLGLKANLAASLGGRSQTYNIGVTDPYFLDTRWTLGGDLYRTQRDWTNYSQRDTGGDIKGGYALTDDVSTYWLYKLVKTEIYGILDQTLVTSGQLVPSTTTSSVMGSITLNMTDYRPDPSSGLTTSASAEFAGLGGTTRYLRYIGEAKYYQPLFWSVVGSARGMLGYMQSLGREIYQQDRFFVGGINTVRGYDTRSVCPTTPLGQIDPVTGVYGQTGTNYLGGVKEGVFNLETVFPLVKEAGLKAVLFYDAGYAWGQTPDGKDQAFFSRFLTSYGGGVRWFSPMGPLRLEYGIPLNPRTGIDKASGKLEFSMGGFF